MFTFEFDMRQVRWMQDAACQWEDGELFFPISEVGPADRQIAEAKAVCARCPVRESCLAFALDNGLDDGVFGGLTADERRALSRARV